MTTFLILGVRVLEFKAFRGTAIMASRAQTATLVARLRRLTAAATGPAAGLRPRLDQALRKAWTLDATKKRR